MDDLKTKIAEAIEYAHPGHGRTYRQVEAALQAIHDAGYVVVPREPTEAMLDQGVAVMEQPAKLSPWHVWTAMIKASPPYTGEV